jgi:cupin fold WbuC family metalloprotein
MKVVDMSSAMLDGLTTRAISSPRRRQHHNMHATHADPVQRLFNAVDVDSYIRPHRHWQDPKAETLLGIRGTLTFVTFDDVGRILEAIEFGEQVAGRAVNPSIGVEIPPGTWHTVVANEPGAIIFEVKAGPFDAGLAKEWAPWAPPENSLEAAKYLSALRGQLGLSR